jgi:multiple sugar transport system permease protein
MSKDIRDIIVFILPLVLLVTLFLLFPVIGTFWISLWRDVSFLPREFTGFGNYLRLFQDAQFWQSTFFTITFSLISVTLEMILGIVVALVINERFKGRGFIRGVALLPWAIPSVIGARIWQLIYRYDYGLANYLVGGTAGVTVNWLGTPTGAMFSLVAADVWRTTPFVAIIILAGLQAVPGDLYEQAKIDGANLLQRFTKITLPSIRPVLLVALLFRTIDALRVFDIIYVITGGGPGGSSTSVSLHSYKFFLSGDFGYGSTVSIMLFLMAFIIAIVCIKVGRFRESVL